MHTLKSQKSFLNENSSCRDRTLKNQPKHDVATKSWSYMIESDGTGKHTCTICWIVDVIVAVFMKYGENHLCKGNWKSREGKWDGNGNGKREFVQAC